MYILRALTSWNYDSMNLVAVALFVGLASWLFGRRKRWASVSGVLVGVAFVVWFAGFDWA